MAYHYINCWGCKLMAENRFVCLKIQHLYGPLPWASQRLHRCTKVNELPYERYNAISEMLAYSFILNSVQASQGPTISHTSAQFQSMNTVIESTTDTAVYTNMEQISSVRLNWIGSYQPNGLPSYTSIPYINDINLGVVSASSYITVYRGKICCSIIWQDEHFSEKMDSNYVILKRKMVCARFRTLAPCINIDLEFSRIAKVPLWHRQNLKNPTHSELSRLFR